MKDKGIGYSLIALIFFYGIAGIVSAQPTALLFSGGGITIDLAFPEEAYPNSTITHNFTITAHTKLTLQSFALSIYAPINATWQEIKNPTISDKDFLENGNYTSRIEIQLPPDTNGTLRCEMTYATDQTSDLLSCSFYTTHVSELTFSEMLLLYNEMLANYTLLQANYTALMNKYNGLLANCSTLVANYTALLSEHNELLTEYSAQVASYESLEKTYTNLQSEISSVRSNLNAKKSEFDVLQGTYSSLNSTFFGLQGNYTVLQGNYTVLEGFYNALNDTETQLKADYSDLQDNLTTNRVVMFIFVVIVASLIALLIYMRRKESEPYVVIRKETVSVKPEKKS
jgi:hypothetical protein